MIRTRRGLEMMGMGVEKEEEEEEVSFLSSLQLVNDEDSSGR